MDSLEFDLTAFEGKSRYMRPEMGRIVNGMTYFRRNTVKLVATSRRDTIFVSEIGLFRQADVVSQPSRSTTKTNRYEEYEIFESPAKAKCMVNIEVRFVVTDLQSTDGL